MTVQEYLKEKPLLFDGAMGTYLVEKHPETVKRNCEFMNIEHPEWVQKIHEKYLKAGAVAIKTNTFSANTVVLQQSVEKVKEMIKKGYQIAQNAIKDFAGERFIFADIGPVPVNEEKDLLEAYKEIANTFLECGAQNFLFETMESREAIEEIASYIKEKAPGSFIAVSFAASPEGYTRGGFFVKKLFWDLQQSESIDALGFNCVSGPKHLLDLVQRLDKKKIKKYLTIMPNAGYPTLLGNRMYYEQSYTYFSNNIEKLLEEGVAMVGGCCGTRPKDIKGVAEMMQQKQDRFVTWIEKRDRKLVQAAGYKEELESTHIVANKNEHNTFAKKLFAGEKVIVVELDPPIEPDIDFFMEGAARYKYAGVDAIDIADCPIAKARIDSSILACKVTRELGLTTIPHMTCRDRNINATKALLLGLNVEGVNNVLTVTGDPVPTAMRDQVKTMFSYNSAMLARHIQSLNEEVFEENPFMVSGALNINALQFDSQIRHAKKKIENGVSVLFTQPVLSERGFANLKRAREELDVKILGGIMPVVSYRNACFMNNEMAGIDVQDTIVSMYQDKNREEGEELAYRISTAIIDKITDYVDGYYLITPFKRVELLLRIIHYVKNKNNR